MQIFEGEKPPFLAPTMSLPSPLHVPRNKFGASGTTNSYVPMVDFPYGRRAKPSFVPSVESGKAERRELNELRNCFCRALAAGAGDM